MTPGGIHELRTARNEWDDDDHVHEPARAIVTCLRQSADVPMKRSRESRW